MSRNTNNDKPRRALSRMRIAMVISVQHLEQMSAALKSLLSQSLSEFITVLQCHAGVVSLLNIGRIR